jgi:N-acetylneuraminic acid mutarotase
MVVWGGYSDATGEVSTGGRYNPVTDSWTATSTANAPTARVHHTAIWTGAEMIVFGGYGCNGNCNFNTGGRYSLSTNSWAATTTIDAPQARWYHTAIWTGGEMLVWGGTNGTNYLHTGGKYNPTADSWTATGTVNVALGRVAHTAVWTGGEMFVWGGVDETFNDTNNGGRYNPTDDSWMTIGTNNAPAARDSHTAVWTGSEMIVWGGVFCCPAIDFDTGGRYNAGTDGWITTSTADAPHARDSHTAVWTGGEMLIWGGGYFIGSNFVVLNTGGRYCAQSGPTATPTPTATATPTATPTATATSSPRITPTPRSRPTPHPRP